MRKGDNIDMLKTQKVNTRISTEADLVGMENTIYRMILMVIFIKKQVFEPNITILNQYSMIYILIEVNGKLLLIHRICKVNKGYF